MADDYLKYEIAELRLSIRNFRKDFDNLAAILSDRINYNNDFHLKNHQSSREYIDNLSDKLKNDIQSAEDIKNDMNSIYSEACRNKIYLDNTNNKLNFVERSLSEIDKRTQQQQVDFEVGKKYFYDIKNAFEQVNREVLRTQESHANALNKHQDLLDGSRNLHNSCAESLRLINSRLSATVSAIANMQNAIDKSSRLSESSMNQLEIKLIQFVDSKIASLPKPIVKPEAPKEVLDELKTLSLNIKNLVLQKNTLEIHSRRHEEQIQRISAQLNDMKG